MASLSFCISFFFPIASPVYLFIFSPALCPSHCLYLSFISLISVAPTFSQCVSLCSLGSWVSVSLLFEERIEERCGSKSKWGHWGLRDSLSESAVLYTVSNASVVAFAPWLPRQKSPWTFSHHCLIMSFALNRCNKKTYTVLLGLHSKYDQKKQITFILGW